MRTAVFDLDGTLADTSADLLSAANAALADASHGGRLCGPADDSVAFAGGRAMLRLGLERSGNGWGEAEVDHLYPRLLEHYAAGIAVQTRLYDGAEQALDRLVGDGWRLAVCTNKPAALAEALLLRLGVRDRFAVMLGADSLAYRKPDPRHLLETIARSGGRPERAVLIGDTITDHATARAAGVPCVLVGFGPDGSGASNMRPDAVLAHFDEIDGVLDRMVPRLSGGR